jgi:hypothetical protein
METGYRPAILISIALEVMTIVLLGVTLAANRSRPRRAARDQPASGAHAQRPTST